MAPTHHSSPAILVFLLLLTTGAAAQSPASVQLTRSISLSGQNFGRSLAIDGTVAVVGASEEDVDLNVNSGAAYVFRHDGTTWNEEARFNSTLINPFNVFGSTVAISGAVIAVGEVNGDLAGNNTGNVFIYRYAGGMWTPEAEILSPTAPDRRGFGTDLALDGDVLAVGAPTADAALAFAGAVFMYRFDGTTWQPEGIVSASDPGPADHFGSSVSLDGDRLVVGAFNADDGTSNQAGKLYVYEYDGTQWNETAILKADDSNNIAGLGVSVALDGDWIVGGAQLHNAQGAGSGAAYVFRYNGQEWDLHQKLLASDGTGFYLFGIGVALSGGRILVGAENWAPPGGDSTGKVYLFTYDATADQWNETETFAPADLVRASHFGHAVAIAGDAMLMGAPDWDGAEAGMGAVYAVGIPRVATAIEDELPASSFRVDAIYPNPFRQTATLALTPAAEGPVHARLYDLLGREVRAVFDGRLPAGSTTRIQVDAGDLPAGMYLLRVEGTGFSTTRRLVVMK